MRAMKIDKAEVIASSKINADILGEFSAAFHSANFEFAQRSYIGAEEDFKGDENDPRRSKHHAKVDQLTVTHESTGFIDSDVYVRRMASAHATEYARSIANVRGSEADPDYMEAKIRELVYGNGKVAEIRCLKG